MERRGSIPSTHDCTARTNGRRLARFASGQSRDSSRFVPRTRPNARVRSGTRPARAKPCAAYSALSFEMSTFEGHSLLQALQLRQSERVSCTSGLFQSGLPPSPSCPVMASRRWFPRPRVEWRSSSVAW